MEIPPEVKELAVAGDRIRAIQRLRDAAGLDLKHAKDIVDTLAAGGEVQLGTPAPERREDETKQARIRRQLEDIGRAGRASLLHRKEILELPNIIGDEEDIVDLVQGTYASGTGVLVATQRRLIFVDKGLFGGLKVEDFPHDKISSIQYETGLLLGSVTIFTSGNKAEIKNVDKKFVRSFGEGVRQRLSQPKESKVAAGSALSSVDDLERLASLRDKGILTEEEFAAKKKQILGI